MPGGIRRDMGGDDVRSEDCAGYADCLVVPQPCWAISLLSPSEYQAAPMLRLDFVGSLGCDEYSDSSDGASPDGAVPYAGRNVLCVCSRQLSRHSGSRAVGCYVPHVPSFGA